MVLLKSIPLIFFQIKTAFMTNIFGHDAVILLCSAFEILSIWNIWISREKSRWTGRKLNWRYINCKYSRSTHPRRGWLCWFTEGFSNWQRITSNPEVVMWLLMSLGILLLALDFLERNLWHYSLLHLPSFKKFNQNLEKML